MIQLQNIRIYHESMSQSYRQLEISCKELTVPKIMTLDITMPSILSIDSIWPWKELKSIFKYNFPPANGYFDL